MNRDAQPPPFDLPIPPFDDDAEEWSLGSAMISRTAAEGVLAIVEPCDFYRTGNGKILAAIGRIVAAGGPTDPLAVIEELRATDDLEAAGGRYRVLTLTDAVPTAAHWEYYARIVRQKSQRRMLNEACLQASRDSYDETIPVDDVVEHTAQQVFSIGHRGGDIQFGDLAAGMTAEVERVEQAMNRGGGLSGIPSGFTNLDHMLSGFEPGTLTILAGRPGMGKSAFVEHLIRYVAGLDIGAALLFSLEMSEAQVHRRLIASEARMDLLALRAGRLRETGFGGRSDWANVTRAAEIIAALPIRISDCPDLSPLQLRAMVRRTASKEQIAFVSVDYAQLLEPSRERGTTHAEITETVKAMKRTARELNVPVILLSQLNRRVEQRSDKRPVLSDLRESGSLEAEADVVLFLYREAYYRPEVTFPSPAGEYLDEVEVIVAKQRSGPTGTVRLGFLRHCARFENLQWEG